MTIRSLAYRLAYSFHNCWLMGHDYWPPTSDSDTWICDCGKTAPKGELTDDVKPLMRFSLFLANSPYCWLVGHDWMIEYLGRVNNAREFAEYWNCSKCRATKPDKTFNVR